MSASLSIRTNTTSVTAIIDGLAQPGPLLRIEHEAAIIAPLADRGDGQLDPVGVIVRLRSLSQTA